MSVNKLSKISLTGLAACLGMGYVFHKVFVKRMTDHPLFIEAMETVKQHKGVVYLLGEPIESKKPVLANSGMLLSGYSDVQVRVKGPKEEGIVFLKVSAGEDEKIKIDSIQLQIGKDQSRRLVVRDLEKETNNS